MKVKKSHTHCDRGHERSEENNTYRHGDTTYCLLCAKQNHKNRLEKIQTLVYEAYGNKCACCGETNRMFFTIDHIFNDGSTERRLFGRGKCIYLYLIEQNFPKDRYRLLCFNCNLGRARNGGTCPHVLEGTV